jgi:hypothetical protein
MRKILIISNQNNTKKMIESEATTRGELEQELNAQGISTTDMSFFEGFSRTELTDQNSQLPAKVTYKGRETTDLIITLTPNSIKKVANGADYDRSEALAIIEEEGLEDDVYDEYGVNYDDLSTSELNNYIEKHVDSNDSEANSTCNCKDCVSAQGMTNEEFFVACMKRIKDIAEVAIQKCATNVDDLRDLNLDELVKEFGK